MGAASPTQVRSAQNRAGAISGPSIFRGQNFEILPSQNISGLFRPIEGSQNYYLPPLNIHQFSVGIKATLSTKEHISLESPFEIDNFKLSEFTDRLPWQDELKIGFQANASRPHQSETLFTIPIGKSKQDRTPQVSLARTQLQTLMWRLVIKSLPRKISSSDGFMKRLQSDWEFIKSTTDQVLVKLNKNPSDLKERIFILVFIHELTKAESEADFSQSSVDEIIRSAKREAINAAAIPSGKDTFSIIGSPPKNSRRQKFSGLFDPDPTPKGDAIPPREPTIIPEGIGDISDSTDQIGDPIENDPQTNPETEDTISFDVDIGDLERDIDRIKENRDELKEEIDELEKQIERNRKRIKAFDEAIKDQQNIIDRNKDGVNQIEDRIHKIRQENANLNQQVDQLRRRLPTRTQPHDRARINKQIQDLENRINTNNRRIQGHQRAVQDLVDENKKAEKDIQSINRLKSQEEDKLQDNKELIKDLNEEIELSEKTLDQRNDELNRLRGALSIGPMIINIPDQIIDQTIIDYLRQQAHDALQNNQIDQTEYDEIISQIDDLEILIEKRESIDPILEEANEEIRNLYDQLEGLQRNLENINQEITDHYSNTNPSDQEMWRNILEHLQQRRDGINHQIQRIDQSIQERLERGNEIARELEEENQRIDELLNEIFRDLGLSDGVNSNHIPLGNQLRYFRSHLQRLRHLRSGDEGILIFYPDREDRNEIEKRIRNISEAIERCSERISEIEREMRSRHINIPQDQNYHDPLQAQRELELRNLEILNNQNGNLRQNYNTVQNMIHRIRNEIAVNQRRLEELSRLPRTQDREREQGQLNRDRIELDQQLRAFKEIEGKIRDRVREIRESKDTIQRHLDNIDRIFEVRNPNP